MYQLKPPKSVDSPGKFLVLEVWLDFRPYFHALLVDFCISVGLWVFLFVFKLLTKVLAIDGWAGDFIIVIHSVSTILAFVTFGILFARDVWSIRRRLHTP